jgi:hypothetical protein
LSAVIATLDQILKGLKYSDPGQVTAEVIMAAMLVGILANPVFSISLRRTMAFKMITCFCRLFFYLGLLGGFLTLSVLNLMFLERISSLSIVILIAGAAGFFLIPLPALIISYAS